MNIKIYNFGPIKEFEYDLDKDLIVTYGKNNIGKSYAMQVVYLLLRNIGQEIESRIVGWSDSYGFYENIRNKITAQLKINNNITQIFEELVIEYLQKGFCKNIENSFINTFGILSTLHDDLKVSESHIQLNFSTYDIEFAISDKVTIRGYKSEVEILAKESVSGFEFKVGSLNYSEGEDFSNTILSIVAHRIMAFYKELEKCFSKVYFLPASRSGIYSGMSAFSQIIAELARKRNSLDKKIELPAISEPISDYFIQLSDIRLSENYKGDLNKLAKEIEDEILKGSVAFNDATKTLLYNPHNTKLKLEMSSVSSMVSEITPIVAFLRYILEGVNLESQDAKKNSKPIIFIEEPEAHLHPEVQVKLIEIFCKLTEVGVKLVITSHSNYIFNKLNNLVLAKKLSVDRYLPIILNQTENGSVAKVMEIDELGVNDENFIDISEMLYDERERIIESLNEEADE